MNCLRPFLEGLFRSIVAENYNSQRNCTNFTASPIEAVSNILVSMDWKHNMRVKRYPWQSTLLVTVQMVGILAILFTGPIVARRPLLLLLELLGGGIGVWALLVMRRATFSVMPDVKAGARLVGHGPYRWIRHPMYLAVLLVTGALVAAAFHWWRLGIWVILLVDILVKIAYEETLLTKHYAAYGAYRQQTKRLLPYLY